MKLHLTNLLLALALLAGSADLAYAQTTEFTYQGNLKSGGTTANGNFDFEFVLFDALSGGSQVGPTLTRTPVAVVDGNFSVKLDFGDQYPGANRFLEIRVRPSGGGTFTPLTPRQAVSNTPYAVKSLSADTATMAASATNAATATNATQLGGMAANQYVLTTDPRMADARVPTAGSANYIQNTTSLQAESNFNISGTGNASVLDVTTQYNIGGERVMRLLSSAGLAVGVFAGTAHTTGEQNSFFGRGAGFKTTTGSYNSFFGRSSGQENTTGSDNSFFGQVAGFLNTTGNSNSFFGSNSGEQNTSGSNNAFFGQFSGRQNTLGVENSFVGQSAGLRNTIGTLNSFFGRNSGQANTTGIENTFLGANAGFLNSSGARNSFIGVNAGDTNTTGNGNTIIGAGADVGSANLTNAGAVGSNSRVDQSNSIVLGSISGLNGADANTSVGIGTTSPANRLHIAAGGGNIVMGDPGCNTGFAGIGFAPTLSGCSNYSLLGDGTNTIISRPSGTGVIEFRLGNVPQASINSSGFFSLVYLGTGGATSLCRNASNQISTCSSSLRYKTNVSRFTSGLELLNRLKPITFNWKDGGMHDIGLSAEAVAAIEPLLVTYNKDGQVEGVKYDRIGVVLINAVKEQQAQIEAQGKQIEQQRAEIEQLKKKTAEIDELKAIICGKKPDAQLCRSRN